MKIFVEPGPRAAPSWASSMDYQRCPVCMMPARIVTLDNRGDDHEVDCVRCGSFFTSQDAAYWLRASSLTPQQIAAISSYIRRNAGLTISRDSLARLRAIPAPSLPEKMERLLLLLSRRHPTPGEDIQAPAWAIQGLENVINNAGESDGYPEDLVQPDMLAAAAYVGEAGLAGFAEFHWLLYDCLIPQGLLKTGRISGYIQISPAGWQQVARLQQVTTSSRVGFVAMAFQPSLLPLYDQGLALGITDAGYEPLRVDRHEHNNQIDDEVIALIKRSRFLVADFSIDRGGIYFEAGLAMGLNLPVVWTVQESQREHVHFDTRQFNYVTWEEDNFPAFRRALRLRIEATIGRGPLLES